MEDFTATYTMTPRLLRRMARTTSPWYWYGRWVAVGLMVLLAIVDSAVYWASAVIFVAFTEMMNRWQLRPFLKGEHSMRVTFTEDEYRSEWDVASSSRKWSQYQRVSRRGEFWVLRVSPIQAAAFPAAALTDDQTARLMELLRRKGLAAD